jgi:hypothetical protein
MEICLDTNSHSLGKAVQIMVQRGSNKHVPAGPTDKHDGVHTILSTIVPLFEKDNACPGTELVVMPSSNKHRSAGANQR